MHQRLEATLSHNRYRTYWIWCNYSCVYVVIGKHQTTNTFILHKLVMMITWASFIANHIIPRFYAIMHGWQMCMRISCMHFCWILRKILHISMRRYSITDILCNSLKVEAKTRNNFHLKYHILILGTYEPKYLWNFQFLCS